MASKIKFDYVQRLLNASNDTINDLLKENFELKQQIHMLMCGRNEINDDRRTTDYSK